MSVTISTRRCSRCETTKPLDEFTYVLPVSGVYHSWQCSSERGFGKVCHACNEELMVRVEARAAADRERQAREAVLDTYFSWYRVDPEEGWKVRACRKCGSLVADADAHLSACPPGPS